MGRFARVDTQPTAMGFFVWHVSENLLFGDAFVADLYNISAENVSAGVNVEDILAKIVPEDRPRIARNIHNAILSGNFSSAQYRVVLASGGQRSVVSFGRCLKDKDGLHSFYSGTVIDLTSSDISLDNDPLSTLCRAALSLAERSGNALTARYLSSALRSFSASSG